MYSAFRLARAAPATGARVFADTDERGARGAADGRVAEVVQRVVRHVVLRDVVPHVARRPRGERVDLDEAELRVALDDAGPGARRRLVAADGRDPRAKLGERLAQRLDLTQAAALRRVALPQTFAVARGLRFEREARRAPLEADAVARAQALDERVRVGEEQVRVEIKNPRAAIHARERVHEHAALDAEAGGERHVVAELLQSPAQNNVRRPALEPVRDAL